MCVQIYCFASTLFSSRSSALRSFLSLYSLILVLARLVLCVFVVSCKYDFVCGVNTKRPNYMSSTRSSQWSFLISLTVFLSLVFAFVAVFAALSSFALLLLNVLPSFNSFPTSFLTTCLVPNSSSFRIIQ